LIAGGATLAIRDALAPDREFIVGTLLPSAWGLLRGVRRQDWARHSERLEEYVCSQTVRVCCLQDDPAVIIGWAAATGDRSLLYVYVKRDFRGHGIGKALRLAVTDGPEET